MLPSNHFCPSEGCCLTYQGGEYGCYWGIWISFYFYYIPVIKMGDLHRVKGVIYTGSTFSISTTNVFLSPAMEELHSGVVINQSISPFCLDTNKSCTSKLLT